MIPVDSNIGETIRQRAQEWMEACKRRDAAVLEPLLADEFVLVAARGLVDKAAWLHAALHEIEIRSFAYVEPRVRLYGEVAVMLADWHQEATMSGREWSGDFRFTDTWVWRDGRWQVVLRHSTQYQ